MLANTQINMVVFWSTIFVTLCLLPLLSLGQNLRRQTCSKSNMAIIQPNANAWIGGIISLNLPGTGGYGCGDPDTDMQAYEAIRWVLDLLNKKNELLQGQYLRDYYVPGIQLGMMVKNYCSKELAAVAAMRDIFPELNGDDEACTPTTNNFTLGIIGASTSGDAITLSDATVSYKIPVVSYEATATQLTLPGMHPNFMRTVSPDGPLMEVITQVMIKLQWKFIAIVYDSGVYGRQAYNELHARLIASEICLTAGIMIDADDVSTANDTLNRVLGTSATGVVYFGPRNYAEAIISAGNRILPSAGRLQWLLTDFALDTMFANTSVYQRGIITVTAASRLMAEFEDHWIRINESNPSPENPWFTEWYENKYNCKFNPTAGQMNCNNMYAGMSDTDKELQKRQLFQQSQDVEAAVMTVYTYARALRNAQMTLCPTVPGACPALQALSRDSFMNDYLKKVNFTFTADERVPTLASKNVAPYNTAKHLSFTPYGDVADPSYYIYNYNDIDTGGAANTFSFRRVGSYIGNYLDFNLDNVGMYSENRQVRLRPLPTSLCPSQGCTPCLSLPSDIKYYFEQGDIIVNGIFSLHQMGVTPLTCGPMMSVNQYMYLEAMIYAVSKVNQDNTILNNIMLGGLGMDDCSSSVLGQALLAQVQRGNLQIKDKAGKQLEPRKIEAYSAAYTTSLTLPLAEAMNMLMRPMVGYRAGGTTLDDQTKYPYYIRALPGSYDEMKAIVLLLKRLKWMYVQVVTSSLEYSQDTEGIFRELASKAGICIVATHNIGQTSQDADGVVSGLTVNSDTQPTVLLLETQDIRRLLMAYTNNRAARVRVVLIGTTMWGTDDVLDNGLESIAEGAITLSLKHSTLDTFRAYLSRLDVNTYTLNPWFKEWYTAAHNCSLGSQGTGAACNQTSPITDGVNFRLMYEVESVINAIRAIGYGLDSTLKRFCGANYNTVCSAFLTAQNKGLIFLEEIRNVVFNIDDIIPNYSFRFFRRSAAMPFEVNSFSNGAYAAVGEIATWMDTVTVQTTRLMDSVKPSCAAPCLECLYMLNYLDYWYIPGDLVIGAIFDVHYAGNGPFSCGALRTKNGALYTEVFNFALQKINSGSASVKLRNVTLGGLAFDGCTNPHRATAIVNMVHTGMDIMDASGAMFMPSHLISWMSYDSQTTIDTASLVQKLDMPIVSPGATASELNDTVKYFTLFRTIQSDSVVVRGMAEFVRGIRKKYVIVLNSPDTSNRASRDLFREYLASFGICVVADYEFDTDGSMDVIIRNINDADTQFVAVFAEPDMYIERFIAAKNNAIINNPLIFIANRPWRFLSQSDLDRITGSVFFEPNATDFKDFVNYLSSRMVSNSYNNPWFAEIYQEVMNCDLPGSFQNRPSCSNSSITSGSWVQDIWTLSTINAVYALAEGIHRTLMMKCGINYAGVCAEFVADSNTKDLIMSNMDAQNFTDITNRFFQFIQRMANSNYKLQRYDGGPNTVDEGSLDREGALTPRDLNSLISIYGGFKSDCAGDCLVCSIQQSNLRNFTLIPGDIYIIGLFDVHKQGSTPFTCGDINLKHGLPLLEAFNYALEYVNTKSGIFKNILPGVLLGGIGLDMCQSPSRAAELVANIQSGNLQLMKNGVTVNPRKIDAYVASLDTESTIRVADILTQLAIPQVSYGATGMDLLNRQKYTYFLRSVPADDKQARAMISYLKKFKYNNIQVVNSFDEIGEPGMEEFRRLALINRICITKEYTVGEGGNVATDSPSVVQAIARNTDASVVVLWFKNPLPILEAASTFSNITNKILFITTDMWGADPNYLNMISLRNLFQLHNLVILDVETADIPGFDQYLENMTPDNYQTNPWFKDYFEVFQSCYWDTPRNNWKKCDKSSTIPRADFYMQDSYTLYVMNAVFSIAMGIHNAIGNLCNIDQQGYYTACNLYTSSGERRQKVMEGLLLVNFTDDTNQPFYFTEDGQSSRGFHVYNVTNATNSNTVFQYQNIGSYNDTNFLKLDITYETNYMAHCDDSNSGCVCKFEKYMPSRFMKIADGNKGLSLVYIGDIHQASPTNPLACGQINTGSDLQKLLAFFYAIQQVNMNMNKYFPNSLKLDGLALDSCTHGIRLGQDVYNVLSGNRLCDSDEDGMLVSPSTVVAFVIDKDKNALPVAHMLSQQNITSISPTAGSVLLDNKFIYPYFLRTRGDNAQTAQVIFEVAENIGWDYLTVVYTDLFDYKNMADTLLDNSIGQSVCVGDSVPLPANATLADAQQVLQRLSQQVGARAVALFVDPHQINLLMQASRSLGLTGRFIWLMVSDWEDDGSQVSGLEEEAAGAIIVDVRSAILKSFRDYVMRLTYKKRGGIPDDWFDDIFETLHQCNILSLERPSANRFSKTCTLDEVITDSMVPEDATVLHVIISVYAVANGLNTIPECKQNNLDLSACLQLLPQKYDKIYNGIAGVSFQIPEMGNNSFTFSFDENGNGNAGYIIGNYRINPDQSQTPYMTYQIGDYSSQGLNFSKKLYAANNLYDRSIPSSNCALGSTCTCLLSDSRMWSYMPGQVFDPSDVKVGGTYPDPFTGEAMKVEAIPGTGDRFNEGWAIILSVLACLGGVISLGLFIYLLIMYPVRGGTTILGYILSFGIILMYMMVFPFIAHADTRICGLRRFGLGFVYAIVYSALMVKLVDCWRVRTKNDPNNIKYSKLGSPFGLFMVTVFFVLVQVIINAEWLILREPTATRIFYLNQYWPRCTTDDFYDESLVLSLVYIMVIIFVSLLVALATYRTIKNHRESRWILGILIISVICWVVWCTASIMGAKKIRDAAVAIGLLVNATAMLLLMPIRKLYLLNKYSIVDEDEDEKQSTVAPSQRGSDYNPVYGRQYDNNPKLHDIGSTRGSSYAYNSSRGGAAAY